MSDDFEDLLRRWLRDRAGTDRSTLRVLAGNVAALPPRRPPRRMLPLVASITLLVVALALAVPRFGGVGTEGTLDSTPTVDTSVDPILPGGPEAFADDPRLATCSIGLPSDMQYAFEIARGRDYRRYIPAMLRSPELEVDDAVLVIVYREGFRPITSGALGGAPSSPRPGHRTVCAVVHGERSVYSDVDITGLTIDVTPSSPRPSARSRGARRR